jgi:cytochrome c5
VWLVCLWTAAAQNSNPGKTPQNPASTTNASSDGERLFQAHCGRCHAPPTELSPRIAKTVLQHMRVRAMLSKKDEQEILNYIAP